MLVPSQEYDSYYPIVLRVWDFHFVVWLGTSYNYKSASYLDLHLEIDKEGRLKKLYDKRDDFSFQIVTFPFLVPNGEVEIISS